MKGIKGLFLGIFGTFAFSWAGLILIPNLQIGHLDPQMDEEGTDVYPAPKSGMAERGRRVYVANGCVYCHTQQVRADYAASDIDRKWGERRSAPRDYLFDRPALLGKMRMGPDLANIGKRAPVEDANAAQPTANPAAPAAPANGATPSTQADAAPAASPNAAAPATSPAQIGSPAASPAAIVSAPTPSSPAPATKATTPAAMASASAPSSPAPKTAVASPAGAAAPSASGSPTTPAAPGVPQPAGSGAAQASASAPPAANPATTSATSADTMTGPGGGPIPYTAAWHHRHLYSPRSINGDSNMPSYAFLYEKRAVGGQIAADALQLSGADAPKEGTEIVPTYDAKCLVAYLMSLDQSHPLKEVKSVTPPSPPAPAKGVK
ncbi:MAG: cbb3-type cytochrome c oxidase subunit II [Verrucomicrobiota bacterium]|nr:cbb3-type cytochrome c oxidase subunit II [Verrucomicrobiota bacterium]